MKKMAISLIFILATGFVSIAKASEDENIWYIGGNFGLSRYHNTNLYILNFNSRVDSNAFAHKNKLGYGMFVGYKAHQNIGFELGYDWFGSISYQSDIDYGNFKSHGVSLITKINKSITENVDVYTRLGGMVWSANFKGMYYNGDNNYVNSSDINVTPLIAIGFEYNLNKNLAARIDYQRTKNVGSLDTMNVRSDNSMLNLGISYNFKQYNDLSEVVAINKDKRFLLKSNVLFNFGDSKLTQEGQMVLDQLLIQLTPTDFKGGSIEIIGFTDRLGSEQYNTSLSKSRAQNVINYLCSKNFSYDKVIVDGMGKVNSITKNICDNIQDRDQLINCLAPDRRVEITIEGISK